MIQKSIVCQRSKIAQKSKIRDESIVGHNINLKENTILQNEEINQD
jgi:hypothetical protein